MSQALVKTESRSLTLRERATRALDVFRTKSAPDFSGINTSAPEMFRFNGWGWNRSRGKINHKAEVGDLDLNSLAMAVVNCTALRIPEAVPAVVSKSKKGTDEIDPNHPCAKLISRPNRHNVWANYSGAASLSWWFSGNVYFYKTRNDFTGEVNELWYLPHHLVIPRWAGDKKSPEVPFDKNNDPFLSHYQFSVPGKAPVLYPASDILHLKRQVNLADPRLGLGAFESLYKELLGDDKVSQFTAAIMTNMGIQVPVISPKDNTGSMDPTTAAKIKQGWMAKTTGDNAGEPVIWDYPVDVEKFGFSPKELDLSDLRKAIESRVCAVCQISPAALQLMIGLENGTSYASSEQARQQVYEEVIIPIQSVWAQTIKWQLLSEFEGTENSDFIFDTSDVRVLQEDRDAKYKRTAEAYRCGITTLNEARMSIEKETLGDDGDIYLVPSASNPMTIEKITAAASDLTPPPVVPPIDPASLAKFAEMERMFEGLEQQMKGFQIESGNS